MKFQVSRSKRRLIVDGILGEKSERLHCDVGMAANFPCPLQSCTVGFSLFFFKTLFAKLAIKSPYLTDSERSAAELYLLIFYCVLPENLCFCVLCIIMIRLSYNKLFWKLRLKSYPLRTFVFFVCTCAGGC